MQTVSDDEPCEEVDDFAVDAAISKNFFKAVAVTVTTATQD